jgi:alpha-beta hydrolase superfamily lysophospholipase
MTFRAKIIGAAGALLLLGGCASMSKAALVDPTFVEQSVRLPASKGRELELSVWSPSEPVAAIVFSAGGGGQPRKYERMLRALAQEGFLVVAPRHDDALARGDLSGSGGPDSFARRIEDLAVARGYVKGRHGGLPLVVMGHSFGSLMSSLPVGATTPAGPQRDPSVRALVAFSSPGIIPGLLTPDSYRGLAVPLLMVTGDKDVVEGFVTDWRSHRAMYDASAVPGSALVVVSGADHNLMVEAQEATFQAILAVTVNFIRANALGDAAARARLSRFRPGGATVELR